MDHPQKYIGKYYNNISELLLFCTPTFDTPHQKSSIESTPLFIDNILKSQKRYILLSAYYLSFVYIIFFAKMRQLFAGIFVRNMICQ